MWPAFQVIYLFVHYQTLSESACVLSIQYDLQTIMHMLLLNPVIN